MTMPPDGGKAIPIAVSMKILLMSAIGTKQTSACALHMSAFDPKRTSGLRFLRPKLAATMPWLEAGMRRRDFLGATCQFRRQRSTNW